MELLRPSKQKNLFQAIFNWWLTCLVTLSLTFLNDGLWTLHVFKKEVDPTKCDAIKHFPPRLSTIQVSELISALHKLVLCAGHPDDHFVSMIKAKKGKLLSVKGDVTCYLDKNQVGRNTCKQFEPLIVTLLLLDDVAPVWNTGLIFFHVIQTKSSGKKYLQTVRTINCNTFAIGRCGSCVKYRANLRSIYKQWSKSPTPSVSSQCNERYLNTPEKKEKSSKLRSKLNAMDWMPKSRI